MRLNPIFTITLSLTALLLVGCSQQDTSLNAPEIASVSLAKGGGGAEEATFTVTFSGDVAGGPYTWTRKLKAGGNIITTDPHEPITLDMSFFSSLGDCFEFPPHIGPLIIREAKKNADHTAEAGFWFEAKGIDYELQMFGDFDGPWLPASGTTTTVTLSAWEMGTESNKFKNACTGSENFDNITKVKVERLAP